MGPTIRCDRWHIGRSNGRRTFGQPKTYVNPDKVREMRNAGTPWRAIAKRLGIGTGTACRALQQASHITGDPGKR